MLALDGLRVLDLSRLVPGPYASMLLADLGAEVIKVEDPGAGDYMRGVPPRYRTQNPKYCILNRGKRSITLNLKKPEGREIFLKLAASADVVLESFRPGVVDRLGVAYKDVRAVNPRIVYCSLTGYGQDGPRRDEPGHDVNYMGIAGLLDTTGPAGGPPVVPSVLVADMSGGLHAAFAIAAALLARERGKGGQYLDVSMFDGIVSWLIEPGGGYFVEKKLPPRGRLQFTGGWASYGVYEAKDGRWLTMAAMEPKFWDAFCAAVGLNEFKGLQADPDLQDEMRDRLASLFKTRPRDEWLRHFEGRDLPVGPVNTMEEALRDPHVKHRGLAPVVDDPTEGPITQLALPIRFSATPPRAIAPAPSQGEHTDEILRQAGFPADRIARLRAQGVV